MRVERVNFKNEHGQKLAARLELPDTEPLAYAVFAHCFTCNKNLTAVANIGRKLTEKNIAVLRFDFTGLGQSEGEFENSNFSSNVQDLLAATEFLAQEYNSPSLLVGHSLGGAAVIYAANMIHSIKAVVTIGAPSNPAHVAHLIESSIDEIEREGKADVRIGGRSFTIKKQFLEDISNVNMQLALKHSDRPILVMHSPQDLTVGIENAKEIYKMANHPKSFISLNGADHLLSDNRDSTYTAEVIAAWSARYLY